MRGVTLQIVDELAQPPPASKINKAWESAAGVFDYTPKEVRPLITCHGVAVREELTPVYPNPSQVKAVWQSYVIETEQNTRGFQSVHVNMEKPDVVVEIPVCGVQNKAGALSDYRKMPLKVGRLQGHGMACSDCCAIGRIF